MVVPDRMRPLDYEVFSVGSVEGFPADGGPTQPFLPFYAANDLSRNPGHRSYYTLRRQPHLLSSRARVRGPRSSYLGHDVFVSLVDGDNAPVRDDLRQLGLDLMCTNRDLPISMPVGKKHTDFTVGGERAGRLDPLPRRPDHAAPLPRRGRLRLALHLPSRAQLPEPGRHRPRARRGRAARAAAPLCAAQRHGRRRASSRACSRSATSPIVRRIPGAGPVCAGRGLQVTLTMDDSAFGGTGGILLAAVLDRFFAKYVSINAFTETVMRSPDRGEVMRWPMRLGSRAVL